MTYIHTDEGWLYLAAILDMATRKIVGPPGLVPLKSIPRIDLSGQARTASQGAMRETLHAEIALSALDMAIERQRPGSGLIHHSDRGIQYACEAYRQTLAAAEISPSMSGKGNCLEFKLVRAADQTIQRDRLKAQNAPMESFFHSLKVERVHTRRYATPAEARRDLFAYIEGFYNSRRLHSALGYITPSEAEEKAA